MKGSKIIIIVCLLLTLALGSLKTLQADCLCDVSTSCDIYCCCDKECSTTAIENWNNFTQCASQGYAIPLCTSYYSQPFHTHDLYQGLRLIYTIVKRLFCISKINFIDATASFKTTSTDAQITINSTADTALSSNIGSIASLAIFNKLPLKDSMGLCGDYVLRVGNIVKDGSCRKLVSTSNIATDDYFSVSKFLANNNISPSTFKIYDISTPSSGQPVETLASSYSPSINGNVYSVIKQIKLVFIKSGSSYIVDADSSYIVVGLVTLNPSSYVYLKYSYDFISKANDYSYSSSIGYQIQSPLSLLKSVPNGTAKNYYKIFNPINLAFINIGGACRTTGSDNSDQSNIYNFRFGVDSILSCSGSSSLLVDNLKNAFDYIGKFGNSLNSLGDFISIDFSQLTSNNNLGVKISIFYQPIGTQFYPQYQITKASASPISIDFSNPNQYSLVVEYIKISSDITLYLPSPPIIDAYLPNDFLYPFYVA